MLVEIFVEKIVRRWKKVENKLLPLQHLRI